MTAWWQISLHEGEKPCNNTPQTAKQQSFLSEHIRYVIERKWSCPTFDYNSAEAIMRKIFEWQWEWSSDVKRKHPVPAEKNESKEMTAANGTKLDADGGSMQLRRSGRVKRRRQMYGKISSAFYIMCSQIIWDSIVSTILKGAHSRGKCTAWSERTKIATIEKRVAERWVGGPAQYFITALVVQASQLLICDTVESHYNEIDGTSKIFHCRGNFLVAKSANNEASWHIKKL